MQSLPAILLICTFIVSACSSELYRDHATHLAVGDEVKLKKSISVKALYSHVIFQDGKIIKEIDLSPYRTSCLFDVNDLGPATYQPQSFKITKVNYNEEMYSDLGAVVRYFIEFHLELNSSPQTKHYILTCQVLDDTTQHQPFPTSEIKQATGHYFEF